MAASAFEQHQNVNYTAAAMLLDADDPSTVFARSDKRLLAPETDDEISGIVPNAVFPRRSKRSVTSCLCSTAWPMPRSAWPSWTASPSRSRPNTAYLGVHRRQTGRRAHGGSWEGLPP